jgi:hypothetical protein
LGKLDIKENRGYLKPLVVKIEIGEVLLSLRWSTPLPLMFCLYILRVVEYVSEFATGTPQFTKVIRSTKIIRKVKHFKLKMKFSLLYVQ